MSPTPTVQDQEVVAVPNDAPVAERRASFRLRAIMRQGTAASLPGVWEHYATTDAARAAAREMYHDDRVLRAFIVTDEAPPQFVAWVER